MSFLLAGAAVSGLGQLAGGLFGASAAREEARLAWEQTLEDARRLEYDQKQNVKDANYQRDDYRTTLGASGVRNSGTASQNMRYSNNAILELKQEQGKELAYLLKAGSARASQIKSAGKTQLMTSVLGAAATGITGYANSR